MGPALSVKGIGEERNAQAVSRQHRGAARGGEVAARARRLDAGALERGQRVQQALLAAVEGVVAGGARHVDPGPGRGLGEAGRGAEEAGPARLVGQRGLQVDEADVGIAQHRRDAAQRMA
jgi:hypothetical protein